YYSTRGNGKSYSFGEAVTKGLVPDGGLFMPEAFPVNNLTFDELTALTMHERITHLLYPFVKTDFTLDGFSTIVRKVFNFPCITQILSENLSVLELFHGPTLAFKDFGARFLANVLAALPRQGQKQCVILVATSGDTGSAVANAFSETEGIKTVILYPKGKVSRIQELQLTTFDKNITAFEVQGTFDDCQTLVKQAFLDAEINERYFLSSANSINIARLLPQAMYYVESALLRKGHAKDTVFVTPSGNLGNLTAGLFARNILHAQWQFTAALNNNWMFEEFLQTGVLSPRKSVETYSNAMDVGNPSNLERIKNMYGNAETVRQIVSAYHCSDEETLASIQEMYRKYSYLADPHTAVGYNGACKSMLVHKAKHHTVLSTAHPVKFDTVIEKALGFSPEIPDRLKGILMKNKHSIEILPDYQIFKENLVSVIA
ncbi:MAG: threonine synthase, partial [Ignavibacteriales bacterium]|nr:threonine synthase [Ignavibacteriales bacterium]